MNRFERHFTLSEAQARIPRLRELFDRIHVLLGALRADRANPLRDPLPELPKSPCNGHPHGPPAGWIRPEPGAKAASLARTLSAEEKQEVLEAAVRSLIEEGIVIQDLDRGLIDFPAMRYGEEVLLCYELEDGARIGWWHEIDAGYAGRERIRPGDFPG